MPSGGLASLTLSAARAEVAPDGSAVRPLLALEAGSVAHFELPPGTVSRALTHRTVGEIWYILGGRGEMWRKLDAEEEILDLRAGLCLALPAGSRFQFRCRGVGPLSALGLTMPRWPGPDEAQEVEGPWTATV